MTNNSSSSSSGSSLFDFIPHQYHRLIAAFWPGPLTLLLPASPLVPAAVTAGLPTMAVRMPAHPVARALIAAAGVPLAAPSANTSGRPSPTSAQHVLQDLAGKVAAVVDGGPCSCGVESTVLDGLRQPPVVLRPGGVTAEQMALCPSMAGLQVRDRAGTRLSCCRLPDGLAGAYQHRCAVWPPSSTFRVHDCLCTLAGRRCEDSAKLLHSSGVTEGHSFSGTQSSLHNHQAVRVQSPHVLYVVRLTGSACILVLEPISFLLWSAHTLDAADQAPAVTKVFYVC